MLVMHGVWAYGALQLWAEDAAVPAGRGPRARQPAQAPGLHPWAAGWPVLAAALAELDTACGDTDHKAGEDELVLRLPSAAGAPLASPALIREPGAQAAGPGGRVVLAAWRVPVLTFGPAAAGDLLGALGEPGSLPSTTVPGGSVIYLAALARLAADLAGRGRVLPALVTAEDGGWMACWRPVLSGADAQRARELAAAMPPLCRAAESGGPGGLASAQVLSTVLDALSDAHVRARLNRPAGFGLLAARGSRRGSPQPVAERWAAALTGADAAVSVLTSEDEAEAAALAEGLDGWHSAAQVPAGPVRTCFRLTEPDAGDAGDDGPAADGAAPAGPAAGSPAGAGPAPADASADRPPDDRAAAAQWRVEFALQSTDDPSLMLPADGIWAAGGAAGWAAAGIRHPEEELLAGLGAASRLFPRLDQALRTAAPEAVTLDTAGALSFLRETGPLLSGAGFGVLLPDWVRRSRLGLKITTRAKQAAAGSAASPAFGLGDLVEFQYELAVGDELIDPAELAELVKLKIPLVRLRGQWVELDDRHLQAALKFLERGTAGSMTAGDALLAGLRGTDDELPVVGVDADGWLGDLLSGQADQRLAPVATPAAFRGELRPYQERGIAWMSFLGRLGLGGVLADSMGLGKSVQLLGLLAHERETPAEDARGGPTLLICPMSIVGNWEQEAARFTPELRVHVHHGTDRLTGEELTAALNEADLIITTYGVAARDREALSQVRWRRVVCDEAQNIKNAATRQARAVRALPAGSRIALTGTPVENRLADLWSIMEFTSPGLLGSADKFRTGFAVPIERNGDPEATQRLRRITGPFILRRLKTDRAIISDLPDKLEMKTWCNLTPEQASLYQATVTDMLARIEAVPDGIERRGLVLATMAKLKQVCNHPAHLLGDGSRLDGRSGKLARLEEICDEVIAEGDKALCFTQYAEFGRMLQPYLASRLGCPVLFLHGGTPKKQRDALVAQFQGAAEPSVFLLSLKAGGTGLNLTAASHVIHVDRWWNPAVEEQATDRAFRIGQRKDVQVRTFVCVGTLEERIDAMIEEKKALAERIVGTGESWLTELSVAELRSVVALSPEAVAE
ncbi:MAG: SNF2-related protein [Streptosporangiaceae bacterium]|jgi:SNF2 family DNA or RNA helicase